MTSATERAAKPKVFAGYAGKYRFDGERLSTIPERATAPEYLVEQVRRISFDSPTRMTATPMTALSARTSGLNFSMGTGESDGKEAEMQTAGKLTLVIPLEKIRSPRRTVLLRVQLP